MNWGPPQFIRDAHVLALDDVAANHYSLPRGRANLRIALSKFLSPSYKLPGGRALDPNTEIQVTAGANEGEVRR
jgi:kynurenine aminotransferase